MNDSFSLTFSCRIYVICIIYPLYQELYPPRKSIGRVLFSCSYNQAQHNLLSCDSIQYSPAGKKIVNLFEQDTCNNDIMASLHKHKMAAYDSMWGSEINHFTYLSYLNFLRPSIILQNYRRLTLSKVIWSTFIARLS